MENALPIIVSLTVLSILLGSKKLRQSSDWQATVTPLASIMGSGFLVSAPLLASSVGNYAVLCMAALLVFAYAIGEVIRFNIQYFEPVAETGFGHCQRIGFVSRIVLSFAYLISISYYLQLLGAFVLSYFPSVSTQWPFASNLICSTLLISIASIGMLKGLDMLEKVEQYAVSLNLSVIAALLASLFAFNAGLFMNNNWQLAPLWPTIDTEKLRILLGLLIVVQGFETSRYLGDKHPAAQRIRTMRYAQIISSVVYISFLALATVLFSGEVSTNVTGIITMTAPIAMILPIIISIAAIGSQFSAASADNAGAGGLIEELSNNKLSLKQAYGLILAVTLTITWFSDVNQVIAYASRAFALYYFLQCCVAISSILSKSIDTPSSSFRLAAFSLIALCSLSVFVLGIPAE